LHIEIPLTVALSLILYDACDPSNGAILIWAVLAYWYGLPTIEWALVVRLVDNLVLHLSSKIYGHEHRTGRSKVKRE